MWLDEEHDAHSAAYAALHGQVPLKREAPRVKSESPRPAKRAARHVKDEPTSPSPARAQSSQDFKSPALSKPEDEQVWQMYKSEKIEALKAEQAGGGGRPNIEVKAELAHQPIQNQSGSQVGSGPLMCQKNSAGLLEFKPRTISTVNPPCTMGQAEPAASQPPVAGPSSATHSGVEPPPVLCPHAQAALAAMQARGAAKLKARPAGAGMKRPAAAEAGMKRPAAPPPGGQPNGEDGEWMEEMYISPKSNSI